MSRLSRDFPRWLVTHHTTAASPDGIFLARRPVSIDDAAEVFATAASDEQELRRRLSIQETIAQRLITYGRPPTAHNYRDVIAAVISDLEKAHPRWRITYEVSSAGAEFLARRPLPAHHAELGLGAVEAPTAQELRGRLACQDALIAAVSMAEGPGEDSAGVLTDTVAGFENLLRRAAGEL